MVRKGENKQKLSWKLVDRSDPKHGIGRLKS